MLSSSQRTCIQTKGVVIGRILLGLIFFVSGVSIIQQGIPATAGFYGSLGLPVPMFLAVAVLVLKIVAGGALIIGKHVGAAAAALAVFTLLTIFIAHLGADQITAATKNLAIIGGLLYVMAFGAGSWSAK